MSVYDRIAEYAEADRAPCETCEFTVDLNRDPPADCGCIRCATHWPCLCDVEDPQDEKDQR